MMNNIYNDSIVIDLDNTIIDTALRKQKILKDAFDIEYLYPFGWEELEGIHSRTDYDLGKHSEYCGKEINYLDPQTNERYIPYVIETSA